MALDPVSRTAASLAAATPTFAASAMTTVVKLLARLGGMDQPSEGTLLRASQPLHFFVMMPECLNGCSRDEEASCQAEVKGALIEVSSQGSFRHHRSTCTMECPHAGGPL
jgi:hypothetical protein